MHPTAVSFFILVHGLSSCQQAIHEQGFDTMEPELPAHRLPPHPSLPFPGSLMNAHSNRDGKEYDHVDEFLMSPSGQEGTARISAAAGGGTGPPSSKGPDPDIDDFRPLLSIDASSKGNIARFINHSCEGNLTVQVR